MENLIRFDWAIKYLLRDKANFEILEGFLSELLLTDIKIQQILESEGNQNAADDKFNRVDVLALTENNERIIIEVQSSTEWDFLKRVLYAASKTVIEHLHLGKKYREISKTISVNIVFFDLGNGKDYLYKGTTNFIGVNYHDHLQLANREKAIYGQDKTIPADIFPEYYLIKVMQFKDSIQNTFDEWVYFLKYSEIKPDFKAKGIQKAAEKLKRALLDDQAKRQYDRDVDNYYYQNSLLRSAKIEYEMDGQAYLDKMDKLNEKLLQERLEIQRLREICHGKASVLVQLLEKRFGALPKEYSDRLLGSSLVALDEITDKILEISTLSELFEEKEKIT